MRATTVQSKALLRAVVGQRELFSMLPPFPSLSMVNTDNFPLSIMFTYPMSLQGILLLCTNFLEVDTRTETVPRILLQKVLYYMKERERERALELVGGGCHRVSYLFLVVLYRVTTINVTRKGRVGRAA